jgi:Second Messenger Oligonucleotide or Dinucleotide Synthetase domain
MTVAQRFDQFLEALKLTQDQVNDGIAKHSGVRNCLNRAYWNENNDSAHSMLVGSWGKSTRIRPPRDVDILFELPSEVYERFQRRTGNKQSQLLQEVKDVLLAKYSNTAIKGDGPVVLVPFSTYAVEVAPAFKLQNGQYWICITRSGGTYKTFDPTAEITKVKDSDDAAKGNTRALIRMLKRWQEECTVPLKSFFIELLAIEFLAYYQHKDKSTTYYDWITRDFLHYLVDHAQASVMVPGTFEFINLGSAWKSKAESARDRAIKACEYESAGKNYEAGTEWQKIYGTDIPIW